MCGIVAMDGFQKRRELGQYDDEEFLEPQMSDNQYEVQYDDQYEMQNDDQE